MPCTHRAMVNLGRLIGAKSEAIIGVLSHCNHRSKIQLENSLNSFEIAFSLTC
jgi:hypothetical protein